MTTKEWFKNFLIEGFLVSKYKRVMNAFIIAMYCSVFILIIISKTLVLFNIPQVHNMVDIGLGVLLILMLIFFTIKAYKYLTKLLLQHQKTI